MDKMGPNIVLRLDIPFYVGFIPVTMGILEGFLVIFTMINILLTVIINRKLTGIL